MALSVVLLWGDEGKQGAVGVAAVCSWEAVRSDEPLKLPSSAITCPPCGGISGLCCSWAVLLLVVVLVAAAVDEAATLTWGDVVACSKTTSCAPWLASMVAVDDVAALVRVSVCLRVRVSVFLCDCVRRCVCFSVVTKVTVQQSQEATQKESESS